MALIDDTSVDAIVIVTPTHIHREQVIAAAAREEADLLREAAGAVAGGSRRDEGRDREVRHVLPDGLHAPLRRRLRGREEADRRRPHRHAARVQGHVARSVPPEPRVRQPGEQRRHADRHGHPRLRPRALVHGRRARPSSAIGATIAYPELETVGDIDNAIASLTFTSGKLGVVDLTRSGIYGYDISTEILGLEGTIRIGYLRETPIMVMTKANGVSHDTVPYFMERFRDAYTNQLQNFAQNVLQDGRRRSRSTTGWRRCAWASPRRARSESGGAVAVAEIRA